MTTSRRRADLDDDPQDESTPERDDPLRCTWVTNGKRCFLTRGHLDGRHKLCSWHHVTRDTPRLAEDFQEFERWMKLGRGYCSEENHWPIDQVWDAILGVCDLVEVKRRRCQATLCRKVS